MFYTRKNTVSKVFWKSSLVNTILLTILFTNGCSLFQKQNLESLSYIDQKRIVLDIVPLGTSRETTIKKLNEAGVVGGFSRVSQSVYYCQYQATSDKREQVFSIMLLFDKKGNFYATQQGATD